MTKTYTSPQLVAMALGGALLGLQTWMLVEYAQSQVGMSMALQTAVPVLTVTLAALPVLMEVCWRQRAWIKGFGLLIVFGLLVGYTLPAAVGRVGETRDVKIAEAQASNRPLSLLQDELARARQRVADADAEVKRESASGCKTLCDGWKRTSAERQARVDQLMGDIAKLGTVKTGPGDTPRLAAVLGISEAAVNLYQPLFLPLAMEMGVWVLLWFGFSSSMMREVRILDRRPEPRAVIETVDPVIAALQGAQRPLSNDELAAKMSVTKGESSKRVARAHAAGLIRKDPDGRRVAISLN